MSLQITGLEITYLMASTLSSFQCRPRLEFSDSGKVNINRFEIVV